METLRSLLADPWFLIAVISLIVLAVVVVILIWTIRKRRKAEPRPEPEPRAEPKPKPPKALWKEFVRSLPAGARGDPVVIVLGERAAGKTSLIGAAVGLEAQAGRLLPSRTESPALQLYAGNERLIQEISGEVLSDLRPATRKELRELWSGVALQAPLVLVVLDAGSPSFNPEGLADLGNLVRGKIDCLTELRRRPVGVRVCLTHLDRAAEGFVEHCTLCQDLGGNEALRHMPLDPAKGMAPFETFLILGLRCGSLDRLRACQGFLSGSGARLLSSLEPFLAALLSERGASPPPELDGLVLAALPPDRAPLILGDPLRLDREAAGRDIARLKGRRLIRAVAAALAATVLLLALYSFHYFVTVPEVVASVESFEHKTDDVLGSASADGELREGQAKQLEDALAAELAAKRGVRRMKRPWWWPPLALAFPKKKRGCEDPSLARASPEKRLSCEDTYNDRRDKLLAYVQEDLLLPRVEQTDDRSQRVYALALLTATNERGNEFSRAFRQNRDTWADTLGIPASVLERYVELADEPFTRVPPLEPLATPTDEGCVELLRALDAIERATGRQRLTTEGLRQLRGESAKLKRAVSDVDEADALKVLSGRLAEERGLKSEMLLGKGPATSETTGWVRENREALSAVETLVREAEPDIPHVEEEVKGKSLKQALRSLKTVADEARTERPVHPFSKCEGRTFSFDEGAWAELIARSRSGGYIDAYLERFEPAGATSEQAKARNRLIFFGDGAGYPAVRRPAHQGRTKAAELDGIYTEQAFTEEVAPALEMMQDLDALELPWDARTNLTSVVWAGTVAYAEGFNKALNAYFRSYRPASFSLYALRAEVEARISPTSWLAEFLNDVAANARPAIKLDEASRDNRYRLQIARTLNDFSPLVDLMAPQDGQYPLLKQYNEILAAMAPLLDLGPPRIGSFKGAPLEERLAPIGTLGMAILLNDKTSPEIQVREWLDTNGIPARFREPFVTPVSNAFSLGKQDIEQAVAQGYRDDIQSEVEPLLDLFPFNPHAVVDADPAELTRVFGPEGAFRDAFTKNIAPVCVAGTLGTYRPMSTPLGPIKLPGGVLELEAYARRLESTLWDQGGEARPLVFEVMPALLPHELGQETVTLSSLRCGDSAVYGMNQMPGYQRLAVTWSEPRASTVGIKLRAAGGHDESYQQIDEGAAAFSFFRLLQKANRIPSSNGVIYTWTFEPTGYGLEGVQPVSFRFRTDPMGVWRGPGDR